MNAECQICFQTFPIDKDIVNRKERHEARHHRTHGIISEKYGHETRSNNIIVKGEVKWKIV